MSSLPKTWECSFPGCEKRFTRKEHLNRHKLSHNPEHQYKCHICGRCYARSDVFKRHVKQHKSDVSQPLDTTRICLPCGERNTQCDGNTPCGACVSSWTGCLRACSDANSHHAANTEPTVALPTSDPGQASWLPSTPNGWGPGPLPGTPSCQEASNAMSFDHEGHSPRWPAGLASSSSDAPTARFERINFATDIPNSPLQQTTPPTSAQSQRTPEIPGSVAPADLQNYLDVNSSNTKRLVDLFFREIHPYWAILHAPTFELEKTPPILVASMVILASWFEKGPDHHKLAPIVFDEVSRIRMVFRPPLHLLQAILFYVVYATYTLSTDGMVPKALNLTGLLVSTSRYLGIFNGQFLCNEMSDSDPSCPFAVWRITEQLNRLAFSVLRVDTYLSMLLDHPPSVRYQELWIPLPKSSQLWAASNEPERRKLQWNEPAGREKALFSFFMRDALNPYRGKLPYCLTDIDYHLSTCAAQATIWEFAREAHSSMSDELADEISPGVFVDMARPQLTLWRDKSKQDYPLLEQYFAGSLPGTDHLLAPLTFTLMFMATLKMFAPMNVLRIKGHYYKSRPGAAIPTRKPQTHLQSWISTGCPRAALWNAAQICRIFVIESTRTDDGDNHDHDQDHNNSGNGTTTSSSSSLLRARLRLNPLLIPGVLKSAIVACSYARLKGRCANCRSEGESPGELPTSLASLCTTSTTTSVTAACSSSSSSYPSSSPIPTSTTDTIDDVIHLFSADEQSATFQAWRDQGTPTPYWGGIRGSESVRVCKCQLSRLAAWFRGAFADDEAAQMEFVLFLAELSGEPK